MASLQSTKANVVINVRARKSQKDLMDRAARVLGKSRSDFLLEAACKEAESILLDRTFFNTSEQVYENFLNLLDMPINEKLKKLMNVKAPWDANHS